MEPVIINIIYILRFFFGQDEDPRSELSRR